MLKQKKIYKKLVLVVVLLMTTTDIAQANTAIGLFGNPQMTLILSIIVGLLEAFVVEKLFHIQLGYIKIIIANLISSILGAFAAAFFIENVIRIDEIEKPKVHTILLLLFAFIASVFIEWPFFGNSEEEGVLIYSNSSLHHSFYAQVVSYSLILVIVLVFQLREKNNER